MGVHHTVVAAVILPCLHLLPAVLAAYLHHIRPLGTANLKHQPPTGADNITVVGGNGAVKIQPIRSAVQRHSWLVGGLRHQGLHLCPGQIRRVGDDQLHALGHKLSPVLQHIRCLCLHTGAMYVGLQVLQRLRAFFHAGHAGTWHKMADANAQAASSGAQVQHPGLRFSHLLQQLNGSFAHHLAVCAGAEHTGADFEGQPQKVPLPCQARTAFDETEIAALAVSILQNGLLQPISVRKTGYHKYQLVAGERRLRACRLAKLERIPAIIQDFDDSETAALGLLENLQRAQLDAFDAARGIREVIRLWNCTQAEAARRLGLSQPALANKLRLLTLTTAQQQLCTAAGLTERHARAVLRLPESRRTAALEKIARDKLSVREADRLVDAMLAAPKDTPGPCRSTVPMVGDVRLFVNTLQHAVDLMTQRGIPAVTSCEQADGFLEYTVRIPTATPAPLPVPNTLPACHEPEMPSGEGSSPGEEDELVRS